MIEFNAAAVGGDDVENALDLVKACYKYILTENTEALALIARQKGCPSHLRYRIWPILLKRHPFVTKPYIHPNFDEDDDFMPDEIPTKRIRSDLRKYFRKNFFKQYNGLKDSSFNLNDPYSQLSLVEKRIFKTLEYSIVKFLKKWGKFFKYEPGLAWIALGLAEWFPPLFNNKHYSGYNNDSEASRYVLLSKDMSLGKFEKIYMGKNMRQEKCKDDCSNLSETSSSSSSDSIFFDDPNLCETSCIINLDKECNVHYDNYFIDNDDFVKFQETIKAIDDSVSLKYKMSFPEIFERLVLVILHSPDPNEEELDELSTSMKMASISDPKIVLKKSMKVSESLISLPVIGGSVDERLSFFHYLLRKLLNDVSTFFKEEGILTSSLDLISGGDEWLLWWIKWCGAKALNKNDRGRIWDLLLGWRPLPLVYSSKTVEKQIKDTDPNLVSNLGNDIYWEAVSNGILDETLVESFKDLLAKELLIMAGKEDNDSSLDKLVLSAVVENHYAFSIINPHVMLIFIYLALLKSQEDLIFELDQAEIRQVLNNGLIMSNAINKFSKKKASKSLKSQHKSYVTYEKIETLKPVVKSPITSPQPNERQLADFKTKLNSSLIKTGNGNGTEKSNDVQCSPTDLGLSVLETVNASSISSDNISQVVVPATAQSPSNRSSQSSSAQTGSISPLVNSPIGISVPEDDEKNKVLPLLVDKSNDDIEDVINLSAKFWRQWLEHELKGELKGDLKDDGSE